MDPCIPLQTARRIRRTVTTILLGCLFLTKHTQAQPITCSPATSDIYVNTIVGNAADQYIWKVTVNPGGTLVGTPTPTLINFNSIAATRLGDIGFNPAGQLYGIEGTPGQVATAYIYAINHTTGSVTTRHPGTIGYIIGGASALTFDKTGSFYAGRTSSAPYSGTASLRTSTIVKNTVGNGTGPGTAPLWVDMAKDALISATSPNGPTAVTDAGTITDKGVPEYNSFSIQTAGAKLAGDILFYGDRAFAAVFVSTNAAGATVNAYQLVEFSIFEDAGVVKYKPASAGGGMRNISAISGINLPIETFGLAADAYGRIYAAAPTLVSGSTRPGLYLVNPANAASTLFTSLVNPVHASTEHVLGASGFDEANLTFLPRINSVTLGSTTCSPLGVISAQMVTVDAVVTPTAPLLYSYDGGVNYVSSNTGSVTSASATIYVKTATGCPAVTNVTTDVGQVCTPAVDTDGDGIPNSVDLDDDNDGILDTEEGYNAATPSASRDTDGDTIPDYLDLDSDNDGISDLIENGNPLSITADTNGDGYFSVADTGYGAGVGANGVLNSIETGAVDSGTVAVPVDTDGDGVKDYRDLDSDNDGINDITESGIAGLTDANNDGTVDGPDADMDGIMDSADSNDAAFGGSAANTTVKDTDGDGVKDFRDLDADNDGINDVIEAGGSDPDGNGQVGTGVPAVNPATGIPTTGGNLTPPDTDGDGAPNNTDLDSDNDGKSDLVESGNPTAIAGDIDNDGTIDVVAGGDPDGDGIQNPADGTPNTWGDTGSAIPANTGPVTTDAPDYINPKSDGTNDDIDSTPHSGQDVNNDGVIDNPADPDGDGIANVIDTKPTEFGGLPYAAPVPDLRPLVNMIDRSFINPTQMSKSLTIRVANIGTTGSTTTGTIQVFVSVGSNFTLELDGTSSVWTLTDTGGGEYTLSSNAIIPRTTPVTSSDVPLVLKAKSTVTKGNYSISVLIDDNAGGETNNANNGATVDVNASTP